MPYRPTSMPIPNRVPIPSAAGAGGGPSGANGRNGWSGGPRVRSGSVIVRSGSAMFNTGGCGTGSPSTAEGGPCPAAGADRRAAIRRARQGEDGIAGGPERPRTTGPIAPPRGAVERDQKGDSPQG